MEKKRVTDKRKPFEESEYVAKRPTKKPKKVDTVVVKLCKNCKAEMNLVKTRGLLNIYKCPNCSFTTEEWV